MCASSLDGIVFFSVSVLSILGNQLGLFLSFPLFIRFTVSWINFADPLLCLAIFHLSGCFFLVFTSLLYLLIVPTILKCFFLSVEEDTDGCKTFPKCGHIFLDSFAGEVEYWDHNSLALF